MSTVKACFYLFLILLPLVPANAQIEWEKNPYNPVLSRGGTGSWDESGIFGQSVLIESNVYRMWFSGWSSASAAFGIGYATSNDGLNWQEYEGNPVVGDDPEPGTVFDTHVSDPCVIRDDEELNPELRYKMWYGANDGQPYGNRTRIGYATSPDGILWTRYENPVLDVGPEGSWDAVSVETPFVVKDSGQFMMWFTAQGEDDGDDTPEEGELNQIGFASSLDGINWIKFNDPLTTGELYSSSDPVVKTGDWTTNDWDGLAAAEPSVILNGSSLQLWYVGVSYENWPPDSTTGASLQVGYATSSNGGTVWVKYPSNPVIEPGEPGEWDEVGIHTPMAVNRGNDLMMWFTTYSETIESGIPNCDIGAATSSPTGGIDPAGSSQIITASPNPFDRTTSISVADCSTIKIFDTSGRMIRTLYSTDGVLQWNGRDSSGNPVPVGLYIISARPDGLFHPLSTSVLKL